MARPLRIEYPGAFYHVIARGNEKKDIFFSQSDREKFLSYLESATERYGAAIHCYCLMNNHYHLLLQTPEGNLSQIMRHINGAYTTYVNVKHKRVGHLLQGRYKAILVEANAYAAELSRYIHLNPVRAGLVTRPEEYSWSSYRCFVDRQERPRWLLIELIRSLLAKDKNAATQYQQFVEDGMDNDVEVSLKQPVADLIMGDEKFVQEVVGRYIGHGSTDRNVPALQKVASRWTLEQTTAAAEAVAGKDRNLCRKLSIALGHRYSGASLKEIGNWFGVSDAVVAQTSLRLMKSAENEEAVRKVLAQAISLIKGDVKVET